MSLLAVVSALMLGAVLAPQPVHAAASPETCRGRSTLGIEVVPKWYKYLVDDSDPFDPATQGCKFSRGFPDSIPLILLAVFEILLRVAGIAAVVFVIYGGFQYLTSTGEPDKAKAARTTITNALVGVMIVMFATVIVNVIGRGIV